MANHLFFPLLVPLLSAVLAALVGQRRVIARSIALAAVLFDLGYSIWLLFAVGATGRLITQADDFAAPFGISLVADGLSAIMLTLTSIMMLVTVLYSFSTVSPYRERYYYYPLLLLLLFGCGGAFLTG
ncbi:MAG: short chain dehydrogenase, partial [Chloroflexaceae bacterium]|nr:short chain dehydrogenase [Chloroflexaceae bacterium]